VADVAFRPHTVVAEGRQRVAAPDARVVARYDDGTPAWLEKAIGKGRLIYVGHRAGLTYPSNSETVYTPCDENPQKHHVFQDFSHFLRLGQLSVHSHGL